MEGQGGAAVPRYNGMDVVADVMDIPVYPRFALFKGRFRFCDTPYVCEDDNGGIAYIDEESKNKFLEWLKNNPLARRQ